MCSARFALSAIASVLASASALGSEPADPVALGETGRVVAAPAQGAITVDGKLDEDDWARATPVSDFTQTGPIEFGEPSFKTQMRVLTSPEYVYVGFRCFDDEPELINARVKAPDAGTDGDDWIFLVLDTNGDKRSGYFFRLTAAGGKTEGLIDNGSSIGNNWDGIWEGRVHIDEQGWTAEFAIPAKTIAFDVENQPWGINASRWIGRKNELIRWRNARRNGDTTQVARAGELTGITELDPGLGLTIKPFYVGQVDITDEDIRGDVGLDVFYRLDNDDTLALTYNTDFAETEVDDRIVNLTRFPTFFPEQRDFFLEDAGVFGFGGINQSPLPFFSRRIGIVNGEQRDILAGARLTGREGDLRYGLLNVQMQEDDELGEKNLSVVRLQQNVGEESAIGMMLTNGDPTRRGNNTLIGVDSRWRHTDDATQTTYEALAWAQVTRTDATGVDDDNSDTTAVGGNFNFNASRWNGRVFFARIGENYDPALGFVQRRGRYELSSNASRVFLFDDNPNIYSFRVSSRHNVFWLLDGEVDSADVTVLEADLESQSRDEIELALLYNHENIETPFEIIDGVTIPTGRYDSTGVRLQASTAFNRDWRLNGSVTERVFYTGSRTDYRIFGSIKPTPGLEATAEYILNDIRLDEGDFAVRIARSRVSWQLTPELSFSSTLQWDNQSDELGLNARMRWEYRPGQELFVVYNEGFDVEDDSFRSQRQDVSVKLGFTMRF